ncbi:sigma 54-interacting transcriptional regulator [Thermoanaerobacter uzonensis]|uniref:sigma 54-interacting transcriptional regulator n=1 Tax=Thermoanaerobacter uzonensis TaxID=447593 RepID=UPI003D7687D4
MKDIVLIAPFEDLAEVAKKVVNENKFANVDILMGDLSEGVEVAKECVKNGAQIIISRGGTYKMIKEAVNIPVVEIKISSFDILRAFKDLIDYKGKIGIAGYENIVDRSETIAELLKLNIEKVVFDSEKRAPELVLELIKKGATVIVGDAIGHKSAKKYGYKSYFITSGKEAIIDAIQETQRILEVSKLEKMKSEKIRIIMDFVHDGIISIDKEGYITTFNTMAEKIFNLAAKDVLGKRVEEIIPNTRMLEVLKSGYAEIGELQDIKNQKIVTNRVPIIVDNKVEGVVATFQDVTQIQELEKKIRYELTKKGFIAKYTFKDILYKSTQMEECIRRAKKYALVDSPVLILGKSGVGKELFAQSIHNASNRASGPFVAINCAAIPPNLLESELFGYAEGAFTGARKNGKPGLFELAHGGTIFLDEIGEIPLEYQARLLRVIEEGEVMRIGDDKVIPVNVRIISATNKNIKKMVDEGKFREDLYYRINILTLTIPDLNQRREDIALLARYFAKKYSQKYGKNIEDIDDMAIEYLNEYYYKGNVRELKGIIERAVILSTGNIIELKDVKIEETEYNRAHKHVELLSSFMSLKEIETIYIDNIVSKCNGNLTKAAKILGINRSTLWRKLKRK